MNSDREWVYYVPEFEAFCIVRPDWIADEQGNPPVEWEWGDIIIVPPDFFLDARENSLTRNAIYIGDL
jgi:hypothetical protein